MSILCSLWKITGIGANFTTLSSIEPNLLPSKVLHRGNRTFSVFAVETLTLTRWPSYPNTTCISWRCTRTTNTYFLYVKSFESYRLHTDRYMHVNKRHRGDWKCRSGKCDTGKIARVENAGVEKAGVDSRGGKCRSKPYGTPTRDDIEKTSSYFVGLVLILLTE